MSKIKLITGSQASLTDELAIKYNIGIIPYYLNYEDRSLKEGIDFETKDFYKNLENIDNLPTSSPPSVGDVVDFINKFQNDYDIIILFTISKKFSQMYNTCSQALERLKNPNIHLIDSGGPTSYQSMMIIRCAELLKNGAEFDEIMNFIKKYPEISDDFTVMGTLKYLAKGGRIGKVSAFMGTLLSIKPIIIIRDGEAVPLTKVRTNKQALKRILNEIEKKYEDHPESKLYILLQGIFVDEWLSEVEKKLKEKFPIAELLHTRLSAITSIHYGPEAWSVTYSIVY